MEKWEIFYYSLIGFLTFSLLLLQVFSIINVDYVTVLFLTILIILPILPKIKIRFKGMIFELWDKKEAKKIKKKVEKVIPEKRYEKIIGPKSNIHKIIDELVLLGEENFSLGLVSIRMKLENIIREIFNKVFYKKKLGYMEGIKWNLRRMSRELLNKQVINNEVYNLLMDIIGACNRAAHGFKVNEENGELLYNSAIRLIAYFYNLNEKIKK